MQTPAAIPLLLHRCLLGEGPIWNSAESRLYWTDIPSKELHSCQEDGSKHQRHAIGREVGGMTVEADGSLLLFMDRGSISRWRQGVLTSVVQEVPELRDARFNDVIAAPSGQVFCGTMPGADGSSKLFRLDTDGTLTLVLSGLGLANGMGFSGDGRRFYLTDSKAKTISQFVFDAITGELTERRPFVQLSEQDNTPDGLTVDADDRVWSARWGGSCIVRYNAAGQEIDRVTVPTAIVTSLTFGGSGLDRIYITTASEDQSADNQGGQVYVLETDVRGKAEHFSRVLTR
jgi:sugar lactone lactonase YvrE